MEYFENDSGLPEYDNSLNICPGKSRPGLMGIYLFLLQLNPKRPVPGLADFFKAAQKRQEKSEAGRLVSF